MRRRCVPKRWNCDPHGGHLETNGAGRAEPSVCPWLEEKRKKRWELGREKQQFLSCWEMWILGCSGTQSPVWKLLDVKHLCIFNKNMLLFSVSLVWGKPQLYKHNVNDICSIFYFNCCNGAVITGVADGCTPGMGLFQWRTTNGAGKQAPSCKLKVWQHDMRLIRSHSDWKSLPFFWMNNWFARKTWCFTRSLRVRVASLQRKFQHFKFQHDFKPKCSKYLP